MKGFVPTPDHVVDMMVAKLFAGRPPRPESTVLDPGCGDGAFIEGIVRWCRRSSTPLPRIVGIESDPSRLREANRSLGHIDTVTIDHADFLETRREQYDYIVGNPPYIPITGLTPEERNDFRKRYRVAKGRFDLYLLFFEQALTLLSPGGRLVYITPEKFLYVRTAEPLRQVLASRSVTEICFLDETTFGELVTYPVVTTVQNVPPIGDTRIVHRDGSRRDVRLATDGSSWLPAINGAITEQPEYTLADTCLRISCGVATGADSVYVARTSHLGRALHDFAFPTIAGREIDSTKKLVSSHSMLLPYARSGELLDENQLGELGAYLREPGRHSQLMARTCVAHKPWYAFHENPPLRDILRPKILCKDISSRPYFLVEEDGEIVPRHSVYYLVPNDPTGMNELSDYLNSAPAQAWLIARCQRAANGFLRLQSHVLKQLPVPAELVVAPQLALCTGEAALE